MATRTSDQHLVKQFAYDHGRCSQDGPDEGARVSANVTGSVRESKRRRRQGPEVIACFGGYRFGVSKGKFPCLG